MESLATILADFTFSSKREITRIVELSLGDDIYRVEVGRSHSAKENPWSGTIYALTAGTWKQIESPWVQERDEETAFRLTLSFLRDIKLGKKKAN